MRTLSIVVVLCSWLLLTYGHEHYWGYGDNLLDQIQSGEDEIIAVSFINPTEEDNLPRQFENKRVTFALENEVLDEQHLKPLPVKHAIVDVTDVGNARLMYKWGITMNMTSEGPVVLVSRKGYGFSNWGPAVLHRAAEVVEMLQEQAKDDLEKKARRSSN